MKLYDMKASLKALWRKAFALLLMLSIATLMPAQAESYKGTMTRQGTKMEYSFSGGKVTQKVLKGQGTIDMIVFIDGEIEAGSTVSGTFKKLIDYGKNSQNVSVEIAATTANGKSKVLQEKKGPAAATASAKVPSDAKEVKISMRFTGRTGRFSCFVTWKVVKNVSSKPAATSAKDISGSVTGKQGTLHYSFSGGTLVKKSVNKKSASYELELPVGSTITVSANVDGGYYDSFDMQLSLDGKIVKSTLNRSSSSITYTLPSNYKVPDHYTGGLRLLTTSYAGEAGQLNILWMPTKKASASSTTSSQTFNWDDVAGDDRCSYCNGQFSNYYMGVSRQGSVEVYCNSSPSKSKRPLVDGLSVIYYNDYIVTGSQSELQLDHNDENGVLTIQENSKVHLVKRLSNGRDRWNVYKGRIVGKNLKHAGTGEPEFHMTQCVAKPTGTTYVLEDDGKTSRVTLLEGSMEVTANKGSKKQLMKPGQEAVVNSQGQITVKDVDVSATAKKFGIAGFAASKTTSTNSAPLKKTNKAVDNRKSSDVVTTKSDKTTSKTTSKSTSTKGSSTTASGGKYARYGAKRGIVKRMDEGDGLRVYHTTWWDDYGRLERRENTRCEEKKGNKWTSVKFTKFIDIIIDDKHYFYTEHSGWKQIRNTETNFMGSGAKTVNGYKLVKSGTATVNGKTCDVFKGKKDDTTLEYYIWEGIPLKMVEKDSEWSTSTVVQSIELPSTIDSSLFTAPKVGKK